MRRLKNAQIYPSPPATERRPLQYAVVLAWSSGSHPVVNAEHATQSLRRRESWSAQISDKVRYVNIGFHRRLGPGALSTVRRLRARPNRPPRMLETVATTLPLIALAAAGLACFAAAALVLLRSRRRDPPPSARRSSRTRRDMPARPTRRDARGRRSARRDAPPPPEDPWPPFEQMLAADQTLAGRRRPFALPTLEDPPAE